MRSDLCESILSGWAKAVLGSVPCRGFVFDLFATFCIYGAIGLSIWCCVCGQHRSTQFSAVHNVIPCFQNPLKNSILIVKTKSLTCYAFQNTARINPQWVIPIFGDMRVMFTVAACCRGSGLASTEVHWSRQLCQSWWSKSWWPKNFHPAFLLQPDTPSCKCLQCQF